MLIMGRGQTGKISLTYLPPNKQYIISIINKYTRKTTFESECCRDVGMVLNF